MFRQTRTRHLARTVAAAAALALVLVGCGGDDDGGAAADDGATAEDGADGEDGEDGGEAASDLFAGELITLVVPFSPGGGYDTYARAVAPFLADELGADVVVENQPGAGGLLALNSLWAAEPDGLTISIANGPGMAGSYLGEAEGVEFELAEFTYLGRLASEPKVFVVGSQTRWESIDDLQADDEGLRVGATGPGASTFVDAELVMASIGIDGEIITGYEGGEEVAVGITADEADGMVATVDSRLPMIEAGDHRALAIVGAEESDDLPGVPTIVSLDLDDTAATIAQAHLELTELGRPLIAPPGMDQERVDVLRTALENVVTGDEFIAEAEEQDRPLGWLDGPGMDELVAGLSDAPEEFLEVLRSAGGGGE